MEVGSLSRRLMLAVAAIRILSITDKLSLSPSSFTRTAIGLPCGSLSCFAGTIRAYHVPLDAPDGLGLALSAGGTSSAANEYPTFALVHVPFWVKPVSMFGSFTITTAETIHIC
jgi:hypothetical protein